MSSAPATRTASPSRREWERRRATITDLYLAKKNKLRDVMTTMAAAGFTASEQQYKAKFSEWGVAKYRKAGPRRSAPWQDTWSHGVAPQTAPPPQPFPEAEMTALDDFFDRYFFRDDRGLENDFGQWLQPPLAMPNNTTMHQPTSSQVPASTMLRYPIHEAAQSGNLAMVQQQLGSLPACCGLRGSDGATPLWLAADAGHLEVVRLILGYVGMGVDINAQLAETLRTPIHQAAEKGHLDVVRLLLERGADPDPHDNNGVTPLWSAAQQGHGEVVQLLVVALADIEAASKDSKQRPLHRAAQNGHLAVAQTLLNARASLEPSKDTYDDETPSPLCLAAYGGHTELAQLLIDKGANVSFRVHPGQWSPLYVAAQNGHVDMVGLLLDNEADADACDADGWSPLMIAAQNNHAKVVELLLQKGANINAEETDGATALWVASQQGHAEVVSMLLEHRAKSTATYGRNRWPIHQAAKNGHREVVKLLLDIYPDDINVGDVEGSTPLCLASQGGHGAVEEYLLEKGASAVVSG